MFKNNNQLQNAISSPEEQETYLESERRDILYSTLVEDIVKINKQNQCFKTIFFWAILAVFGVLCVGGISVIYNISLKHDIDYTDLCVAIAGFGGVISAIIVLPKIIAKHLFPEDSERARFDFIRDNQNFDLRVLGQDGSAYLQDDSNDDSGSSVK